MQRAKKYLIIIFVAVLFFFMGLFLGTDEKTVESTTAQEQSEVNAAIAESVSQSGNDTLIEDKILDILNNTQAHESFAPTIGRMVNKVFFKYEVTWERYQDSKTKFLVEISGTYCPNPDVPNFSKAGSITYLIDIQNGTCSVLKDLNNILSAFYAFIVN